MTDNKLNYFVSFLFCTLIDNYHVFAIPVDKYHVAFAILIDNYNVVFVVPIDNLYMQYVFIRKDNYHGAFVIIMIIYIWYMIILAHNFLVVLVICK